MLEVLARDPTSRARAGVLHLAHGTLKTPAFVPLATKAVVKALDVRDVHALGYEMVLGNTFHLFLQPGHELVAELGGLHRFMGWDGPIITDSGGFQVFSMGHGTVAEEVKGKASHGADRAGGIVSIAEKGVTFRSFIDGAHKFLGPETSMEVQAALGSDLALVFDECLPFHVSRDYTARSTDRTHRWLERCLTWHEDNVEPGRQLVSAIVQGGVHEDLRREAAHHVAVSRAGAVAVGGTLGETKDQMHTVVDWAVDELARHADHKPRHLLGIGEVDDLVRGIELGIDTFDCAMPTRLARHGMALVPDPDGRWRINLMNAKHRRDPAPLLEGCPCPCCEGAPAGPYSRAYLHHLVRMREATAARLLTLHNLAYLKRLVDDLRTAILEDRLPEAAAAVRSGAAPLGDGASGPAGLLGPGG